MSLQSFAVDRAPQAGELVQAGQRDRSLDLARGLALVLMVTVHVLAVWGFRAEHDAGGMIAALVSPISAPTFLFLMGLCFAMSSRTSPLVAMLRGCQLFALGYLLNVFRGTLPVYLGVQVGLIEIDSPRLSSPWSLFIEVDILQCVGLCLVAMAIVRKCLPWSWVWALLAAASIAGIFIPPEPSADHSIWTYCQALAWGATRCVYFPLLPWIAFPLAGMAYGMMRKKAVNRRPFQIWAAFVGMGMVLAGVAITLSSEDGTFRRFGAASFLHGKLTPGIMIAFVGVQFFWLPVCGFIARTAGITPAVRKLYRWSEHVTLFYLIQWIIIGWFCVLLPQMPAWGVIPMIMLVLFLTDATITRLNRSCVREDCRTNACGAAQKTPRSPD
jgi:hypothetical protein